jgi:hypothetical protein
VLQLFPIVPRCLLNDAVWFACRFALYNLLKLLSVWVGWRFDGVSAGEAIWCRIRCWSYFRLTLDAYETMLYGLHGGLTLYQVLKVFAIVPRCLLKDAVWFAGRFAFVSRVEVKRVWVGWRFGVVSAGVAILCGRCIICWSYFQLSRGAC